MEKLTSGSLSVMVVRMKLNLPVNVPQLQKWLATKPIGEEEIGIDNSITIKKVSWVDDAQKWGGTSPTIEVYIFTYNNVMLICRLHTMRIIAIC